MAYELDQEAPKGQPSPEHVAGPQQPPYWQPPYVVGTPGHPEFDVPAQGMLERYQKQQDLLKAAGGGHQGQFPPTGIPLPVEGGEPAEGLQSPNQGNTTPHEGATEGS